MLTASRFERPQYHEIRKLWDQAGEDGPNKTACDTYGAEHLARLLGMFHKPKSSGRSLSLGEYMMKANTRTKTIVVSLPELVAQTTMDQQSVARLREELVKFTTWLGKNAKNYFVSEYETPSQKYIDHARTF